MLIVPCQLYLKSGPSTNKTGKIAAYRFTKENTKHLNQTIETEIARTGIKICD